MEDRQGNIWISTNEGLIKYDGFSFTQFTTKEGLVDNNVGYIKQDSRGYLWICTFNGLNVYDGKQFYTFTKEHGFENERIWVVSEDHLGNMWIGTKKGVYFMEIPLSASTKFSDIQSTTMQEFHKMGRYSSGRNLHQCQS